MLYLFVFCHVINQLQRKIDINFTVDCINAVLSCSWTEESCNDQEKENTIVAGVGDESLHRRHFMNDHDKENLISASRAAVQIAACWYGHPVRYKSSCVWCKHITSSKFSSSKLSTTNHGSCPDCTTASWHRLQHCGLLSESLVFTPWSEVAPHVLW